MMHQSSNSFNFHTLPELGMLTRAQTISDNLGPDAPSNSIAWKAILLLPRVRRSFILLLSGLAIAIVLWGIGYKVSLYQSHSSSVSRAGITKLWTETRHSTLPKGYMAKNASDVPSDSLYLPSSCPHLFILSCSVLCVEHARRDHRKSLYFLRSFRSPPFQNL